MVGSTSPMRRSAWAAGVSATTSETMTVASSERDNPLASNGVTVCTRAPIQPRRSRPSTDALHHRTHDVDGRREADALVPAALADDQGVDSDEPALDVHERPAAAAGVDGRVGLQVDHGIVGAELAGHGAQHAEGDRAVEAEGAAHGEHDLALTQRLGLGERDGSEPLDLDLQHREVGFPVDADEAGGWGRPAGLRMEPPGPSRLGEGRTSIRRAPCTTWAFVTMWPSASMTTPEPELCWVARTAVARRRPPRRTRSRALAPPRQHPSGQRLELVVQLAQPRGGPWGRWGLGDRRGGDEEEG